MEQSLVAKVLSLIYNEPVSYSEYGDYESLVILSGQPKPPKEEFEAKLQELIDAQPLEELRTKRNTLLDQSDKYVTVDFPHATPEKKQTWFDYRQALRDLPTATEDPANPVWPTIPTA
tara:strand:+ start:124 stop:477 length:354 start_codon:yes stop_codon:yes gene_type:complete